MFISHRTSQNLLLFRSLPLNSPQSARTHIFTLRQTMKIEILGNEIQIFFFTRHNTPIEKVNFASTSVCVGVFVRSSHCRLQKLLAKMFWNGKSTQHTRFSSSSSTLNQFQSTRLSAFECEGKYWNIFKFRRWFGCAQKLASTIRCVVLLGRNQRFEPLQ